MSQPTIVAAAIQLADGMVLSVPRPARHPSVILKAQNEGRSLAGSTQGFLTSEGEFVDRAIAKGIAFFAGQLPPGVNENGLFQLYTEDLW